MGHGLDWFRQRARRETWSLVVLAGLLLQALIPAGFMLSSQGGDVSLVLCRGIPLTGQQSAPADEGLPSNTAASQTVCPFALMPTLAGAPTPGPTAVPVAFTSSPLPIADESPRLVLQGPPRAQSSRAPPALI